jgi:D-serine deaminase-like pyridoxal phosphate-dependent protein
MSRPVRVDDLETPVLTADLGAIERNIAAMQAYCDEHGIALRPHIKTHKLPQIARMQVDAGARGITCQKLGEAEIFAEAGFDDILLTFPLVGRAKAERLVELARSVRMGVVGDSAAVAEGLSAVLAEAGAEVDFLVECDTGLGRTGVQTPDEAAELAALVARLDGLHFAGLMTYPSTPETGPRLRAARQAVERAGLDVETVSGGGTPTARRTHELGEVTELRVGTYVYGDRACIANGSVPLEDCALRVVATVVSRPTKERAIVDAGSKTLTSDGAIGATGFGLLVEHPEAEVYNLNEEHGYVDVSACAHPPGIGERVTIVPNHACVTANMHDTIVLHRDGEIVDTLQTAARGKVT